MNLASLIVLMVLSGSWLAFGPGSGHLKYTTRVALSIALSPPVAAIQFYVFRLAGLAFHQVVPTLQLFNLCGMFLILRALRASPPRIRMRQGLLGVGVYAIVAAAVAIPWFWDADFRRYSWHGLLHTDIVYSFARGSLIPEEPEMAGVALAYPWIGHIYWSILAWSADLSPTVIYLVTNLVLLGASGILYFAMARGLGASRTTALATTVILALGTNFIGVIGWSIIRPNDNGIWWAILGDLRYAPFLVKFVTFETMTFGLVLFSALVFLSVSFLKSRKLLELCLIPFVVTAIAALYPNLFPAAALFLMGLIVTIIFGHKFMEGKFATTHFMALGLLTLVAFIGGVFFFKLYTMSRATGVLELSTAASFAKKLVAATLALGPFGVAMCWMWRFEPVESRAPLVVLSLGAVGAVALNLFLRIGGLNEYKFIMAAGICLAAPAIIGFERKFITSQRTMWGMLTAASATLVLVMVSYSINRIPNHGTKPLDSRADSFWLRLLPQNPDAGWIDAVRKKTPPHSIVVVNHPDFHTTSFTGRSLLVPSEGSKYHFGYNMASGFNMLVERGYSRQLFQERLELLRKIYTPGLVREQGTVLEPLRSFGRPLAIIFRPKDGKEFLKWLRFNGIGEELFNDKRGHAVYLLRPSHWAMNNVSRGIVAP